MPATGATAKTLEEEVDEPIPYATLEVYRHTVTRGCQVGSLLFSLVLVPFSIYRGGRGGLLLKRLGQAQVVGALAGGAFLAMGTKQKLETSDAWGVYDRAYRLRYNEGQVLLDKLSYTNASLGLVLGTVVLNRGLYGGLVGFTSGLTLGFLEFLGIKAYEKFAPAEGTSLMNKSKEE